MANFAGAYAADFTEFELHSATMLMATVAGAYAANMVSHAT